MHNYLSLMRVAYYCDWGPLFSSAERVTSILLAHHRQQCPDLPAGMGHHRFDLGAAAHCRADAVNRDVQDLVPAAADPELPVHFNGRALRAGNLTGHDHPGRIGSAAGYPERK